MTNAEIKLILECMQKARHPLAVSANIVSQIGDRAPEGMKAQAEKYAKITAVMGKLDELKNEQGRMF